MEIIGKILSLTLLAIFGTAGTIIYFSDPGHFPSFVNETVSESRDYESDTEIKREYSAYRERLRKGYFEAEQPVRKNSGPQKERSLWTNTYDTPSKEVERLVEENSMSELRKNMDHWNNQYHEALRLGDKLKADKAHAQYRNYREALEAKEVFR